LNGYQSTPGTGSLVVPKGCKNKDAAMKFLAIATSARAQAAFANATAYVPINKDAVPFLNKSLLPFMPFGHNETEVKINMVYQGDNWEMLTKRWHAWQAAA
jgi:putative spermidine/putrescine transport system substrate-binding protein